MKLLKAVLSLSVFAAVMLFGSFFLYDRNEAELTDNEAIAADTEETDASEEISAAAEGTTFTEDTVVSDPILEPTGAAEEAEEELTEITFTFLGDCILSSNAGDTRKDSFMEYAKSEPDSYFFEKALPYYEDSDFVIANSEFVLSDNTLPKVSKSGTAFWFKSPTSFTSILKAGSVDIVSIANNHTYDYGEEGYNDTKAALEAAEITWGDLENPVYVTKHGITFGIICTKMFNKNYDQLIPPVIEEVNKNSDIQILFFHGGTEKEHIPDDWLAEMCHSYADMGVDLIVGSHPHVLRPMEEYNGVDIIYSIGNFCYGANQLPENRTVILTETFTFDENGNYISQEESFEPFYVYTGTHNNWQPSPIEDPLEKSKLLAFMYGGSKLPY
ncbi:MAG: CapA family protein [Huintestinicola sp.]